MEIIRLRGHGNETQESYELHDSSTRMSVLVDYSIRLSAHLFVDVAALMRQLQCLVSHHIALCSFHHLQHFPFRRHCHWL